MGCFFYTMILVTSDSKKRPGNGFDHKRDEIILIPADTKIEVKVYFRLLGEGRIQIEDYRNTDQFQ